MAQCRRCAIAIASGLAVFAALQCVLLTVSTQAVAITTVDITRGHVLESADIEIVSIPVSSVWSDSFTSEDQVVGLVAQMDIAAGTPLFSSMARAAPAVPDNAAVIDVHLAGDMSRLIPGDVVMLVTAGECPVTNDSDSASNSADTSSFRSSDMADDATAATNILDTTAVVSDTSNTDDGNATTCVLASDATVMESASEDDTGSMSVVMALPADDALRVLTVQDQGVIVAVTDD